MKRIEEDGRVVAVLEKRAISAQREGYFVVQVLIWTPSCPELHIGGIAHALHLQANFVVNS